MNIINILALLAPILSTSTTEGRIGSGSPNSSGVTTPKDCGVVDKAYYRKVDAVNRFSREWSERHAEGFLVR